MTEIEIGTAIVSYIEPTPGYAREFNRWYERDHFPATVLAGPGVFAGARFVANHACKAMRPPSGTLFGDPTRGSYLAVAWVLPGKQREWDAWVACEMDTIVAQDRLFPHREHVHTAVYRFVAASGEVPAIVALDRGFPGLIAVADERAAPQLDLAVSVSFEHERTILSSADPPRHQLVIGFAADDPRTAFGRSNQELARCGFASPFLATIPGTDSYTEEL